MNKNKEEEKPADKYTKLNPRLFQEAYKEGKPFNWFKEMRWLDVRLYDIQHLASVSLDGEGEVKAELDAIRAYKREEPSNIDKETLDRLMEGAAKVVGTEGKTKKIGSAIKARAVFEDRTINLFEDGQIAKKRFETAEFICYEGDGLGALCHNAGTMLEYDRSHNTPYLSIETYLPVELFQSMLRQIKEGKITEAYARLRCDVFQSEVERSLAEPWMRQDYTIEAESYENFCGIDSIRFSGKTYLPSPREDMDEDDPIPTPPQEVTPEIQLMSLLVGELRRTNKMLKAIAIVLALIAIFYLFKH